MKSIRHKILLYFCAASAVIIFALGLLISSRLSTSIEKQSEILSAKLIAMSDETLIGYQGVFQSSINRTLEEIEGILMSATLDEYRIQTDKVDYTVLLDLDGKYISSSSFENSKSNNVDIQWIEEFYRSSELWMKVAEVIKTPVDQLDAVKGSMRAVTRCNADFIKAFQLSEKNFAGNAFLTMQAAGIIRDNVGQPMVVVVAGKLLNNYQRPLKEFYDTTGLPCAIYLGTTPINQMGFNGQKAGASATNDLQLKAETLEEIYAADKPKNQFLTLAGNKYRIVSTPIKASNNTNIGALMVGMPEQKITEIDQAIRSIGNQSKKNTQNWILVIGLASLIVFFGVSVLIAAEVAGPISKVAELANGMAGGNLSNRLNITRQDEIGNMAKALDNSCQNLSDMIAQIKKNADTLASASEEMSAISNQMASTAEEMSSQSDTVSGAAEEMSANINSMASAAEQMSVNIQNVSSTAEQMSQNMNAVAAAIEEMSASIKAVAERTQEGSDIAVQAAEVSASTTETMNALGNAAKEIGEVTGLIKQIAEQTNLLALNATIEAASAGDAGKGFAVVANEIKELASQSGQAAEDITRRIEGVQVNTEQATKAIDAIADIIHKINESSTDITKAVQQQTATATEISSNVQQAKSGVNNIASAMTEISRGANDVSQSASEVAKGVNEVSATIQGVSKAAHDSNAGAQQVNSSANALAKMATQIQEMVGRFTVMDA